MSDKLLADELVALVQRVFSPGEGDRRLGVLVDMPDEEVPDNPDWKARREIAAGWVEMLAPRASDLGLDSIKLLLYRNPRANNANLPAVAVDHSGGPIPADADSMTGERIPFDFIFEDFDIFIAPTEFSATAPLKMAAKEYGFRAATMPGFARSMLPALRLDYGVIGKRVDAFKALLDESVRCDLVFKTPDGNKTLDLDLRHRSAHASGGVFPSGGVAGNLPSGESYIVPYEGEIEGDPSQSHGQIPVQLGDEVVVYEIKENRAVNILSDGKQSQKEKQHLIDEPAYGNLSELGLGVLGDFGLEPTGEILLDEKLGLHIAFGRSDHFGGQVGPDDFSSPEAVVHIDRVYISKLQPLVKISEAVLTQNNGEKVLLMKDGKYQVEL